MDKLCIPISLQRAWIREHHAFAGHVGADRLWYHMEPLFKFAHECKEKDFTKRVGSQCETCQANVRARKLAGPQEATPVPPSLMSHISIDIFFMDRVDHENVTYDAMVVCVDRLSGWIIAVPCQNRGLTGKKVAQMLLPHWRLFGIPSVVDTDRGSHFVSQWWRGMCASLGIRQAYAQAYHHQANGRAEVAGQQIKEIMRKMLVEEKVSWVEILPVVLDKIHDAKGQSGLSPYEMVTGRLRPLGNLPYLPEKECEDAKDFFTRMARLDQKVAKHLNELHKKQTDRYNANKKLGKPFEEGDRVWYRRPENTGGPVDSRWLGPALVLQRVGLSSYKIRTKEGQILDAHASFMKPHLKDEFSSEPIPMYFHRRTIKDEEARESDEYEVEKILKHRVKRDGSMEFLTHWKGYPVEEATWEPPQHFIHRYSAHFVEYCQTKNLDPQILRLLQPRAHTHSEGSRDPPPPRGGVPGPPCRPAEWGGSLADRRSQFAHICVFGGGSGVADPPPKPELVNYTDKKNTKMCRVSIALFQTGVTSWEGSRVRRGFSFFPPISACLQTRPPAETSAGMTG